MPSTFTSGAWMSASIEQYCCHPAPNHPDRSRPTAATNPGPPVPARRPRSTLDTARTVSDNAASLSPRRTTPSQARINPTRSDAQTIRRTGNRPGWPFYGRCVGASTHRTGPGRRLARCRPAESLKRKHLNYCANNGSGGPGDPDRSPTAEKRVALYDAVFYLLNTLHHYTTKTRPMKRATLQRLAILACLSAASIASAASDPGASTPFGAVAFDHGIPGPIANSRGHTGQQEKQAGTYRT